MTMKEATLYNIREISSLKDMINQSAQLFGDKNAYIVKTNGKHANITYKELKNDIDALGTSLLALGLKDKFIAVIGENRYDWSVSYLSVVNGTGVVVPLDKELHDEEVQNLLSRSNASAIIYSGKQEAKVLKYKADLPNLKYYINMDIEENTEDVLSFKKLIKKGEELIASGDRSYIDAIINPEIMNMLIFTSGTTDLAKGVMLSHKNICSDITAVLKTVTVTSNDTCLSILPLHHTYECSLGFLAMLYVGGTICFNEGLKHIVKNFSEYSPTVLFTVPLLLENLHKKIWEQVNKDPKLKKKLTTGLKVSNFLFKYLNIDLRRRLFKAIHQKVGGRLRLVLTGAAAIDPIVSEDFYHFGILVLQGYGLTECSPLVIGNRDTKFKHSSVGLPLPGVEAKIVNPDDTGIGEIVVKGPNLMLGYFNNQEATEATIKDGWFYTGDLGYKDEDGFYYITGRSKNVIVTKNGKNIFPEEVESYLNRSPYVTESLVWGKFDEETGETYVNAQIVPNFDAIKEKLKVPHVSTDDIKKFIEEAVKLANKNMPLYKRITDFTIRETEFVKTTTKKIKRYIENNTTKK